MHALRSLPRFELMLQIKREKNNQPLVCLLITLLPESVLLHKQGRGELVVVVAVVVETGFRGGEGRGGGRSPPSTSIPRQHG